MILPAGLILGAIFGWIRAAKRGGTTLDKLQYAGVHAIIFGLVAILISVSATWWT